MNWMTISHFDKIIDKFRTMRFCMKSVTKLEKICLIFYIYLYYSSVWFLISKMEQKQLLASGLQSTLHKLWMCIQKVTSPLN